MSATAIAPLQPFPIRGAIWYQCETNVIRKNGLAYFDKTKASSKAGADRRIRT